MNNKWLVAIAVISAILNILVISFGITNSVIGQSSLITVPPLPKDKAYELAVPNNSNLTCVDLENKLGLHRRDIESISNDPQTGMIIKFKKDIALTSTQVQTATDTIKGLIPDITVK